MNQKYNDILERFFHTEVTTHYSLDNIRAACAYFGNPQDAFQSIHIAGTNGKGSVSKMIFQMLKESGKKVGVYTSPHNIDIRERFEIANCIKKEQDFSAPHSLRSKGQERGNGLISEEDFMRYSTDIFAYEGELSYFDRCVLLAFLYFRDMDCEYVVLEVGLGGRLDSTNIVTPILSIITSISYDHQDFLGDTLEAIAYEKGGIIKPGVSVILYDYNPTLVDIALQRNSRVIFPHDRDIRTNLLGEHQLSNGRIAYEAGVFLCIPEDTIEGALLHVHHDGRLQYITPNLLIDGAHNEDGLRKLGSYLEVERRNWKEIVYCANLRTGKSANILIDAFPSVSHWMIVDSANPRVCRAPEITTEIISGGKEARIISPIQIRDIAEKYPDILFVVFGSLYMLAEFLDQ